MLVPRGAESAIGLHGWALDGPYRKSASGSISTCSSPGSKLKNRILVLDPEVGVAVESAMVVSLAGGTTTAGPEVEGTALRSGATIVGGTTIVDLEASDTMWLAEVESELRGAFRLRSFDIDASGSAMGDPGENISI